MPGSEVENPFESDISLDPWQLEAADAWAAGDVIGPYRGTLEIFTGGGKSLIALECIRRASELAPDLRVAIVVPTVALARQWRKVITSRTSLSDQEIGELRGDRRGDLVRFRVLIAVLNSAARYLPELASDLGNRLMLVVDESHRAGAPQFSRVLDTPARFRLGLSATAEREDVDDDGMPVEYDDQILGQLLGAIVYKFDLRAARRIGWLPDFTVTHHAVELTEDERRRYDEVTRRIDDLADRLRDIGVESRLARSLMSRDGEIGQLARSYVGSVSIRKDILYRASERGRVTECLLRGLLQRPVVPRILLFHERIDQAAELYERLACDFPNSVTMEHSRLPDLQRERAIEAFASGSAPLLVSVKSLIEGIDVPEADAGISVASSASVRQRVQALGRVLRRRFDGLKKQAEMHIIYVADSVDELIYEKEDWGDLTGEAANHYLKWPAFSDQPETLSGPPRTPRPTEEQFWEAARLSLDRLPIEWPCEMPSNEWRVDSTGTVTDLSGRLVTNPQDAAKVVRLIRPQGGRFRISHRHRLIVVPDGREDSVSGWLVGQLDEIFQVAAAASDPGPLNDTGVHRAMRPGSKFHGPLDSTGGSYQIRQKGGGLIERRSPGLREFAELNASDGGDPRILNAHAVLDAWRESGHSGIKININCNGEAYYLSGGEAFFLAHVPEGFAWPDSGVV